MNRRYQLVPAKADDDWDAFVEESPQGTIFSLVDCLRPADDLFKLFYVVKGADRQAGVVLHFNGNGECVLKDGIIHNGIVFGTQDAEHEVKSRRNVSR